MKRGFSIWFALLAAICLGGAAEARPCYKAITNSILELGVLLSSAPQVELLEAGTSPSVQAVWKLYGPDLNGRYGGLNGAGGLEGVSPYQNVFNPLLSDARGNVLAEVTNGVAAWTLARPTGYGAVPGYRPVAYGNGVDLAQSCVFRGREVDVTGYYHFGLRDYDPVSGQWLSYDPAWNDRDPNGQSYCGGDPINRFDADGRMGKYLGPDPWEQFQQQTDDYLQSQYGELPGYALGQQSGSQTFSSLLNIIPLVGGLKMWVELNTGLDLVTGQRIQTGDWTQAAMIGLNILPLALEAAPEEAALEAEVNIPFRGISASTPTETQLEFDFVKNDLSGQLTSWDTGAEGTFSAEIPANSTVGQVMGKLNQYPQVVDARTGANIPFPSGVGDIVPQEQRVSWGATERGDFISQWYQRGYSTPNGGWDNYDIHHILPREYGGGNDFWNLVPVQRQTHQELFNSFWRDFNGL